VQAPRQPYPFDPEVLRSAGGQASGGGNPATPRVE